MGTTPRPIIVIVGPTASGKSDLAFKLAKKHNGEIICADSRTIYKHMNIGTAKPSDYERKTIPHHALDLIEPNESYSASAFKEYTEQKVSEIHERGRVPIIVGGTGLYVDGYVYDYSFAEPATPELRAELEALPLDKLQERARALGVGEDQVDFQNRRHVSRVIERGNATPERQALRQNVLFLGIQAERAVLKGRIAKRVDTMFDAGLIDEVQKLIDEYGADAPGLLAPGYKAVAQYLAGAATIKDTKKEFIRSDLYLAKRQQTWFKRNKDIKWVQSEQDAFDNVRAFLSSFATIE